MEKLSPLEEKEMLRARVLESPEKSKEILTDYLRQKPEDIVVQKYTLSPEETKGMIEALKDPRLEEKNSQLQFLFQMFGEKGILNVASAVKDFDPAIEDAFHDILVQYLNPKKNV